MRPAFIRPLLMALGVMCAVAASPVLAQTWPAKPVKIIVPFAAGGPADVYARFLSQRLQDALGQSFVVDNRPGAGSVIGTDAVAKAAPDGYTLLLMSNTHTVNETLIPTQPFQLRASRGRFLWPCRLMFSTNMCVTISGNGRA